MNATDTVRLIPCVLMQYLLDICPVRRKMSNKAFVRKGIGDAEITFNTYISYIRESNPVTPSVFWHAGVAPTVVHKGLAREHRWELVGE